MLLLLYKGCARVPHRVGLGRQRLFNSFMYLVQGASIRVQGASRSACRQLPALTERKNSRKNVVKQAKVQGSWSSESANW